MAASSFEAIASSKARIDFLTFKQADTAINKLNKNTKNLARNFGLAFGTAAVLAYGRASVRAFAADDKAATSLATTLKNLNLAYGSNIGTVNGFINRLEQQTGVLDDELRPAMDRLLRATGDVTKSQELLSLALDIAAGTGKSVTQVSQSLQKAYLGQTQALGRLGVGLSKAELSTSSFEQIQDRLNVLFAGQAAAAADTYAGSLDRLAVASNNAKETIGKGLVDAFMTATNSSSTDEFIAKIDAAANSMANFLRETGELKIVALAVKPDLVVLPCLVVKPMPERIVLALYIGNFASENEREAQPDIGESLGTKPLAFLAIGANAALSSEFNSLFKSGAN